MDLSQILFQFQSRNIFSSVSPSAFRCAVLTLMALDYRDAYVQQDAIIVDVGSDQHPIYVPSNLLRLLPGNRFRHAMVGEQQMNVIKIACRPASLDARDKPSNRTLILATGLRLLNICTPPPNGPVR